MKSLMRWSSGHPIIVVTLLILISAVMGAGITKVRVDGSAAGMMIKGDPAIAYYEQTLEKFGSDNVAIIFIQDDHLFTPEKIALLDALHYRFEEIKGVEKVESIFSVTNFKSEARMLSTAPLVDFLPETVDEAEQIRADALKNPVLVQNIISKDGNATALNLYVAADPDDPDFDTKFTQQVASIIDEMSPRFDTIFQLGNIHTQTEIISGLLKDQATMVPISAMVLLMVLMVSMRSAAGALLPMITAGTAMLWSAGFMGYMGIPLNILTVIVPSLIIVIGSTEDIHLLSEYLEGLELHRGNKSDAVEYMAAKTGTAVLLTALTTFLGFLSITLNDIIMLMQFGLVASFGLFANPLITCLVVPVCLKWMGPDPKKEKDSTPSLNEKLMQFLADKIINLINHHKWMVLCMLLGGTALVSFFALTVKVDNDLLRYFKPDSDIRMKSRRLHNDMSGVQVFYVRVASKVPGYFKAPRNLEAVSNLMAYMQERRAFDKIYGFTDYLKLIHREMNDGKMEFYRLPETRELVSQYLLTLQRDEIERFVTSDYAEVNIMVRHNIGSSYELNKIVDDIETYIDANMPPHLEIRFTGENILINTAVDSIAFGQMQSLTLLLLIIFVIMSVLFVNIKAGFLSLIPNFFPIVLLFGVMGIFKIPLNAGTAMVSAIAIGVAVDDTIHFMTRYNKEMRALQNQEKAIEACIRAEITPVFSTSVALASGFAVICLASFVPLVNFGFLSACVMLFALTGDLFLTPILLSSTQLITLWDMLKLDLHKDVIERSPLFDQLKVWQLKRVVLLSKVFDTPKGEKAITYGEYGQSMFLLLEGQATAMVHNENGVEIKLSTILPGEVFGEVALANPGPRTANIVADKDMKYLEINWDVMQRIQRIYPRISVHLYRNISKILGLRLKKLTLAMMEAQKI